MMQRLWVANGSIAIRAYFLSDEGTNSVALSALYDKLDDNLDEMYLVGVTEVTNPDQIDSPALENDEAIYTTDPTAEIVSLQEWTKAFADIAERRKQEQREAEAAARQMKLFGDDGT